MARLFWAWAALVWCICGRPVAALAAPPLVTQPPNEQCNWNDEESYRGLRRQDTFERGQVVLTFDDGPQLLPTKRLLDLLDEHGYQASFFATDPKIVVTSLRDAATAKYVDLAYLPR